MDEKDVIKRKPASARAAAAGSESDDDLSD
jgi:hypothetical protein